MGLRNRSWLSVICVSLLLLAAGAALAQEGNPGKNTADMKFTLFPGMPTCAKGSVTNGDPGKGPSFILARTTTGCTFPWHWHTPNENVMMVSGTATLQMKGGKAVKLQAGGYAMMPSNHVHLYHCDKACTLYIYSDAPFDMHYVDKDGKEIPPDEALKAVKETAAK